MNKKEFDEMKNKFLIAFLTITIIGLTFLGTYQLTKYLDFKISISHLEKYQLSKNEEIIKTFQYENHSFIISRYYDDTSSWSHLNLLLKIKNNYYLIKNIKKCDTVTPTNNIYIKNNEIYMHCIGKNGDIDKYIIEDFSIKKETIKLKYNDTPNISQYHMNIDKVDDNFIYLSSPIKLDNTIIDEPKVKCSFKDRKCSYY